MASPYLKIGDLRGGVNDSDAPFSLLDTEVVAAVNVDYRAGQIGSKRGGCAPVSVVGSIFTRLVPTMAQRDTGGWSGSAGGSVSTTAHAGPNTNQILIVAISITAGSVTGMTYNGIAMTALANVTLGNRVEVWYIKNPSLSGNVVISLTGAADAAVVAERWDNVDVASSPSAATTNTGTSTTPDHSNSTLNANRMVINALTWGAATLTIDTVRTISSGQTTTGTARAAMASKIGMLPTNYFLHSLSGSVQWASILFGLLGVAGSPQLVWLGRFEKTNNLADDELWAHDNYGRLDRRVNGVWQGGVPVQNYSVGGFGTGTYYTNAVSLHGKFFIAMGGNITKDRIHVWDGTVLRHGGLAAPSAAPTGANTAAAGAFSGTRYYRVRWTQIVSGVTVRRSEPSAVLTFSPSGVNTGAIVTKPASPGFEGAEGETHWELEASLDNNLFYRIASTLLATTTVTDTASSYTTGTLSEALTEYTPHTAPTHVAVDGDRLLTGGSPVTAVMDSRVSWTPLRADLGVGNDERVPATSRFFRDLDGLNGGGITMMTPAVLGGVHVFKRGRIYKLIRNGRPNAAYSYVTITPSRGCFRRAAHDGVDEGGQASMYFIDPVVGACRIRGGVIEDLMQKRRALMARVNKAASYVAHTIFYPKHWLVWYSLAVDGSTTPNYIACFNIRTKSWTDYTGPMATMVGATLFPDANLKLQPLIAPATIGTSPIVTADSGVNDDGVQFRGYVLTKAYILGDLYAEFAINGSVLHAKASAASIQTSAIKDLGLERLDGEVVSIAATGTESYVTVQNDDLGWAELSQVQFEVGDPASYAGSQLDQTWQLEMLSIKREQGGEVGG